MGIATLTKSAAGHKVISQPIVIVVPACLVDTNVGRPGGLTAQQRLEGNVVVAGNQDGHSVAVVPVIDGLFDILRIVLTAFLFTSIGLPIGESLAVIVGLADQTAIVKELKVVARAKGIGDGQDGGTFGVEAKVKGNVRLAVSKDKRVPALIRFDLDVRVLLVGQV